MIQSYYHASRSEIKFGDIAVMLIKQFAMYFSADWQFETFKRGKDNGHDTCLVYILKYVSLISVTYVVGTHCNCLLEAIPMCTYIICQFNK